MKKRMILPAVALVLLFTLGGCSKEKEENKTEATGIDWTTLEATETMDLSYATGFSVTDYGSDYTLLSLEESGDFLVVAEGAKTPSNLPEDWVVLQQPLDHVYVASSGAMDYLRVIDALDGVSMTGTKAEDWSIPEIAALVESEEIIYAGKYSNPDYEYLIDDGCDLAIENTMIYHSPEVKETIESVGIPTLVERSSYEANPMGRMEWVKLYGVLMNRREEAQEFFDAQVTKMQDTLQNAEEGDGNTAVYFYINTAGGINVRKPGDYISQMISMAGGRYAMKELVGEIEDNSTSMTIQMESFYAYAKDADVLIYNGSIYGAPLTLEDLVAQQPLLADFKAVKNHRVYATTGDMYQQVSGTCEMILDFYAILGDEGANERELTYLFQLQ